MSLFPSQSIRSKESADAAKGRNLTERHKHNKTEPKVHQATGVFNELPRKFRFTSEQRNQSQRKDHNQM